jgi:threonine aldolase
MDTPTTSPWVSFAANGMALSPVEYAAELSRCAAEAKFVPDDYGSGGIAAEITCTLAKMLGKETGILLPTGTMANTLAIGALAAGARVLVQADSHIFCDSGDALTRSQGVTAIPLAPGRHQFDLDDVKYWIERSQGGRVPTPVRAISIESPVRRHHHRMVDWDLLVSISSLAREQGIGMHLDGAKLFDMPHHSGRDVRDYAGLFDTIFVSLRKSFNAQSGAVLLGDQAIIEPLAIERRRLGGASPRFWPQVAPALNYLVGYERDYTRAWAIADELIALLGSDKRFAIDRIRGGTSVFILRLVQGEPAVFVQALHDARISIPDWSADLGGFPMRVNTTLPRRSAQDLAKAFSQASNKAVSKAMRDGTLS